MNNENFLIVGSYKINLTDYTILYRSGNMCDRNRNNSDIIVCNDDDFEEINKHDNHKNIIISEHNIRHNCNINTTSKTRNEITIKDMRVVK